MTVGDIILIATGAALAVGLIVFLLAAGRSYEWVLVGRYLLKRRIAWVSLIAVTLCTTMVLVVISVMGGWLRMFRASFHGLSGDVIVEGPSLAGFPYYQQMIDRIEALDGVEAAVPTIRT